MLTFGFTIELEGILAQTDSTRAIGRIMKQLHAEIGTLWHSEMLPRHFSAGAAARYDYSPRSPQTRQIRKRQHRQGFARAADVDLVRSGKTQDRATRTGVVRAWPTRGEVTFFVPFYIKKRSARRAFDLVRELRSVSGDEAERIRRFAEKRLAELIAANRTRRRRRVNP
jgi:hypothetical protein